MAYQSVPKLIPLKTSNMCPNTLPGTARKECVFRLLLPKPSNDSGYCQKPKKNFFMHKNFETFVPAKFQNPNSKVKIEDLRKRRQVTRSSINCNPKQLKTLPSADVNMLNEEAEDENLLPSKKGNKKSEIILVPVKPKECGCSGPCEIITCEVIVQQYVDQEEISLMLAMNIEEEEIDARVMKHCDNEYCDALSIDHDRCRRGLIQLYRCDKSDMCDICRTTMKGWKSRLYHEKCELKNEYCHNNVSQERLLRDKFRLRELQMREDSKIRRNDYLDPVNGSALALEAIRKNKELVITPIMPGEKPSVRITAVSNNTPTSVSISQPVTASSQMSNPNNVVSNVISLHSNAALSSNNTLSCQKESVAQQTDPILFSNTQRNTYIVTRTSGTVVPTSQTRTYIRLPSSTSVPVQPTKIGNLIMPQSHVVTNSSTQPKTLLTPIRVMPITNLKTAPSLLHRQQGIPKFCIMAGNVITTLTVPNAQTLQPIIAANIITQTSSQKQTTNVPVNTPKAPTPTPKKRIFPQKRVLLKKGNKQFFCVYCCKHFSTDWYFKKHVAKHEKEKHTPRVSITHLNDKHSKKSHASEKNDVQKDFDHDYCCDSPYCLIRSPSDKTDGELEAHEPLEYDTEDCDEDLADKTNNCTTSGDLDQVGSTNVKYDETFDTWNENVEIFKNGIKIETQDTFHSDDAFLEPLIKPVELSFSENYDAENKFTIVSVVGNTNPDNCDEDVPALR